MSKVIKIKADKMSKLEKFMTVIDCDSNIFAIFHGGSSVQDFSDLIVLKDREVTILSRSASDEIHSATIFKLHDLITAGLTEVVEV